MHFSSLLIEEFELRKKRSPGFSMRSYAQKIGLSAASLSLIFKKRMGLSVSTAEKIGKKLKWDSEEIGFFLTLVEKDCARSPKRRNLAKLRLRKYDHHRNQLNLDAFQVISGWHHFAIVELTHCKDFQSDPHWISKKLELSLKEATEAINRLINVGLLEASDGTLKAAKDFYFVPGKAPSDAMKNFHRQLLQKALQALDTQSIEERYFGSSVIHVSREKIPELQKKIKNFRRDLSAWAETGNHHDAIYSLTFQSVRLDRDEK